MSNWKSPRRGQATLRSECDIRLRALSIEARSWTRRTLLRVALIGALASSSAFAQNPESYYDQNTLRASDVPGDAPSFEQFAVRESFTGQPAAPDVRSHPMSRLFRTMIREGAKRGPNFAGHYTIVFWGCGTGCRSLAIVNARNGKVYHPSNLSAVDNGNVAFEEFEAPGLDDGLFQFRQDSKLIRVVGGINEDDKLRGISWFVWDKERLRRIRFVHKSYGFEVN